LTALSAAKDDSTDASHAWSPRSIERRSASPSMSMRVRVTSSRSAGDTGLTRKPRWSEACTSPSATSRDRASRTAARLTENCFARPAM